MLSTKAATRIIQSGIAIKACTTCLNPSSLRCLSTSSNSEYYPFYAICKNEQQKLRLHNQIMSTWKKNYPQHAPIVMTHEEFVENRPSWNNPDGETSFNLNNFFSKLQTTYMGRNLLYSHELTSTQTILKDNFSNYQAGLLCITDRQTEGHGRSTNKWTSPYGCLMFSYKTYITNPRDLPFMQYLATLVMCSSLEAVYHTKNLDIGIKWPNDIYYKGKQKIGGVICQSAFNGRTFDITVGIGINIANSKPTTCMNDIASLKENRSVTLGRSSVLASYCNEFSEAVQDFRMYGFEPFMKDYLDTWIHTDEVITVISDDDENDKKSAIIRGISNETGMLIAETEYGDKLELFPDTHSLNLMDKLLYKKK